MEKLPHELLRKWADKAEAECNEYYCAYPDWYMSKDMAGGLGVELEIEAFRKLADEIERYYTPNGNLDEIFADWVERIAKGDIEFPKIRAAIDKWCVWRPRFEDGEPVQVGMRAIGEVITNTPEGENIKEYEGEVIGYQFDPYDGPQLIIELDDGDGIMIQGVEGGYEFKRPTPKLYDADGVEIKVGDTVFDINNGCEHEVIGLPKPCCYQSVEIRNVATGSKGGIDAPLLTHKRPVFDAEGVRIFKGDTVWDLNSGEKLLVVEFANRECGLIQCSNEDGDCEDHDARNLTHREPDSLEKLRDDMKRKHEEWDSDPNEWLEMADRLTALIERGA